MLMLYVWRDCLWDYGPGLAVAVAHDVAEARDLVRKDVDAVAPEDNDGYEYKWVCFDVEPEVYPLDTPIAFTKNGSA